MFTAFACHGESPSVNDATRPGDAAGKSAGWGGEEEEGHNIKPPLPSFADLAPIPACRAAAPRRNVRALMTSAHPEARALSPHRPRNFLMNSPPLGFKFFFFFFENPSMKSLLLFSLFRHRPRSRRARSSTRRRASRRSPPCSASSALSCPPAACISFSARLCT